MAEFWYMLLNKYNEQKNGKGKENSWFHCKLILEIVKGFFLLENMLDYDTFKFKVGILIFSFSASFVNIQTILKI